VQALNFHLGIESFIPTALYIGMFFAFFASLFWRPSIGIYLLVLTLPMQTGRSMIQGMPLGSHFLDVLLLGTILGLMIQQKSVIPGTNLSSFLLLFTVFCYLSLWSGSLFIHAPLPLWLSDDRFSAWKNYVEMFLFALVVASTISEKKQVRVLLLVMAFSVLLVNRNYYGTVSGRDFSHFSDEVRDAGTMGYAGVNGLAAFEAMVASFLLGIYAFATKKVLKIAILLLVATCGYCLLYSFSRGGYFGFLVGVITVGLFRCRWLLVGAAMILLAWHTLLPTAVQERILMTTQDAEEGQQFDSSSEERLELWQDAMKLFKQNPVTGTGFQTYRYMGRVGDLHLRDTHNYYVKVLAETGIVGLALYLVLLWKLFHAGASLLYGTDDRFWRSIGLGFLALLTTALAVNFFGDRWTYQQVDGYLWVVLGCVIRGLEVISEQRDHVQSETEAESLLPSYTLTHTPV
jgi:O-antigen ligase